MRKRKPDEQVKRYVESLFSMLPQGGGKDVALDFTWLFSSIGRLLPPTETQISTNDTSNVKDNKNTIAIIKYITKNASWNYILHSS